MALLIYIMIIANCMQSLEVAGYSSASELKNSDKILFVVLPLSFLFWIAANKSKTQRR